MSPAPTSTQNKPHSELERRLERELEQLTRWRGRLAQLLMGLGFVLLFSLADALIWGRDSEQAPLRLLVGTSAPERGRLPPTAQRLEQVQLRSPSPELTLTLDQLSPDFWLGLPLWKGKVHASPHLPPGTYFVILEGPAQHPDGAASSTPVPQAQRQTRLEVQVFATAAALQAASPSWWRRQTGVAPGWWALWSGSLLVLGAAGVMRLSHARTRALERAGRAEIFRAEVQPEGLRLWFGLGTSHGLQVGERLLLRVGPEQVLGELQLLTCEPESASALWAGSPASLERFLPVILSEGQVQRLTPGAGDGTASPSHIGAEHV